MIAIPAFQSSIEATRELVSEMLTDALLSQVGEPDPNFISETSPLHNHMGNLSRPTPT